MRKLFLLLAVLLAATSTGRAQDRSSFEVFGGYSYLNFKLANGRESIHGWGASICSKFSRRWAIVGDFSGSYKTFGNDVEDEELEGRSVRVHNFLFGPRVFVRRERATAFGHLLFGISRTRIDSRGRGVIAVPGPRAPQASNQNRRDTAAAFGIGGGVDLHANKWLAIRVAQLDYLPSRHLDSWHQDFRYLGGVVFKF